VVCPECGWRIPLAPSWVIGEKSHCVAKLRPNEELRCYDILIEEGVSQEEMQEAKEAGTVRNSALICPHCDPNGNRSIPITMLRGDRRTGEGTQYGLRLWENEDIVPRPDDVFQERLYCIRWVETYFDEDGNEVTERYYLAPDEKDMQRERKVLELLQERFYEWQEKGYIPSRRIEPGYNTNQPIRERGWIYWHHLFNPRQLLVNGLFFENIFSSNRENNLLVALMLFASKCCDYNAKLSRWHSHGANEKSEQVFSNQALNTLFNYGVRTVYSLNSAFFSDWPSIKINQNHKLLPLDARVISSNCDFWLTDPPYADAINYHELSEFFLAWYGKHVPHLFPGWYADSKRALAITGTDENFRRSMVDSYRNLAEHMPDNGVQIVMFTHQDAGVWADLALILWAAGLRVTAAWCIATETDSALREGNYVKGTVLLVLRKQTSDETAFIDEIYHQVEVEVKKQLDAMLALEDQEDPNFGDTDYQLAAYAAALRVLTSYRSIEDIDVVRELSRPRQGGEITPVVEIINQAVKIACDHLVPKGIDPLLWKELTPEERFYIKGLELESHGEYRAGAYQELARGFGIREYRPLMAGTRANQNRLKTASEFAARMLGDTGFDVTLVRQVLFAVRETVRTGETITGRNWLKNELKEKYWGLRQTLIKLLQYFATLGQNKNMPRWEADADAARLLAGAVENDHV
jgi:putative DNA methylase